MKYDLQQDHNTGNWWIVEQDETGYRTIVRTLNARLSRFEASKYLEKYVEEAKHGQNT